MLGSLDNHRRRRQCYKGWHVICACCLLGWDIEIMRQRIELRVEGQDVCGLCRIHPPHHRAEAFLTYVMSSVSVQDGVMAKHLGIITAHGEVEWTW